MEQEQVLPTIVRTLLSLGFLIVHSNRNPSYIALTIARIDEFGVQNRYLMACCDIGITLSGGDVRSLQKQAKHEGTALVVVGAVESRDSSLPVMTLDDFLGRLGGPVSALLPLEPAYPDQLRILGHNALPAGLVGKPDDLFEKYVHAGLQFVLQDRVVRYGQAHLFEAVPDGLSVGRRSPLMLYDAKAAADGYEITRDTIRQFSDYVRCFHERYEAYTGRVFCFLVVSGDFHAAETLEARSNQLYADCQVPLRFLPAAEMASIVSLLANRPTYRQSLDWKAVFSNTIVRVTAVQKHLEASCRDGVIQGD